MSSCIVIGNPRAGRGKTRWDDVIGALRSAGLEAEGRFTEHPGHGIDLARAARTEGAALVVAAGGDGTVHEVVNGLLSADGGAMPSLGILPLGSGCDYAKTFGIEEDPRRAIEVLASERAPVTVDAGEVTFLQDGAVAKRRFANIAEVGIGASTVARAAGLPRALGGAVYGLAFVSELPRFVRPAATVTFAEGGSYEGPLTNLVVAIARVFGGGMRVAPAADPSDGLFDVQVHFGTKIDYVVGLPKVYKGTHLPHPRIREERSSIVEVTCEPPARIEADGEVLGSTPAAFRVLPGALRVKA